MYGMWGNGFMDKRWDLNCDRWAGESSLDEVKCVGDEAEEKRIRMVK